MEADARPARLRATCRVRRAQREGPAGKSLRVTHVDGDIRIELVDAPEGTPTEEFPVPIPQRVSRYHPVVAALRTATERHEVSRAQLSRTLRILQGLVVEAERRGFTISEPDTKSVVRSGDPEWSGDRDGHLRITTYDVAVVLRVREGGMPARRVYRQTHPHDDQHRWRRSRADEAQATGAVSITIISPTGRSNRPRAWGDTKARTLENELPAVLKEVQTLAAEERQRIRREQEEAERRYLAWEAAMQRARMLHTEHQRAELLVRQIDSWHRAAAIRAFCDAIDADRGDDAAAFEWSTWARNHADQIDPTNGKLELPPPREDVPRDDLRPFLDGWDPYAPARRAYRF